MNRTFSILLFLILFAFCGLKAQELHFMNFSLKEGLPQSNVYDIYQDRQGYIWVATEAGIGKYNGKEFSNYTVLDGLPSNNVQKIIQDEHLNMWFATFGAGLCKFDGKTYTTYTQDDGLPSNYVLCVFEDFDGRIWAGTYAGLCVLEDSVFKAYTVDDGLPSNTVVAINQFEDDFIWLGTHGGICKFNGNFFQTILADKTPGDNGSVFMYKDLEDNMWIGNNGEGLFQMRNDTVYKSYTTENGLPSNKVKTICQDKTGIYWIGTKGGGLCRLNTKKDVIETITEKNGMPAMDIDNIYVDDYSTIWLGTFGDGLYRYYYDRFVVYNEKHGLINKKVRSIFEDNDGIIWASTDGGISKLSYNPYNFNDKKFIPIASGSGLDNKNVMAITQDNDGNMWFCTGRNGITKKSKNGFTTYTTEDGLPINSILSAYASTNDLWFGSWGKGVIKYNKRDGFQTFNTDSGLVNNTVFSIFEDNESNMWFGTYGGGVSKYDGKTFTSYNMDNGLAHNVALAIAQDFKGRIWIGTEGGGISIFDGKEFTTLTTKDGLQSNTIYNLLVDETGFVWVGNEKGLERISSITFEVKHYGYLEGFTPIEVNLGSSCIDRNDNIWFGTINGMVRYTPEKDVTVLFAPKTHITGVKLFDNYIEDSVHFDDFDYIKNLPIGLQLPYDNNNISFDFIGLQTQIPEKIKYQYKLEGFEGKWRPETYNNIASYTNLNPGDYTFSVKACNSEGIWNNLPTDFSFTIIKPIWSRWWFYTSEIGFFLLLVSISIFLNRKNSEAKMATAMMFITLLIAMEFMIMILENSFEKYMGSIPVMKLVLNVILALSFHPIQRLVEKWTSRRRFSALTKDRVLENIDSMKEKN